MCSPIFMVGTVVSSESPPVQRNSRCQKGTVCASADVAPLMAKNPNTTATSALRRYWLYIAPPRGLVGLRDLTLKARRCSGNGGVLRSQQLSAHEASTLSAHVRRHRSPRS